MSKDPRPGAILWPKGWLYEDCHVGQTFEHHWGRTIEADTILFTTLTLAFNPNRADAMAHGRPDIVVNPLLLRIEDCTEIGGPRASTNPEHAR
jgi:acyl dehydratase